MLKTFRDKTILVTGHTGFKGSWLTKWLILMGAKVVGFSIDVPTKPSLHKILNNQKKITDLKGDVTKTTLVKELIFDIKPDFIFHLAGQAIVSKSFDNPLETWQTNTLGSINILNALIEYKTKCNVVMITSDKCYENNEWIWGYKETDRMGGTDPYSASKAAAEIAFNSYSRTFFSNKQSKIRIASARAGNVIGGGDWSINRIIPDCVKSWQNKQTAIIRNPNSYRPWQFVLEPISGYLNLAKNLNKDISISGESFNFGPSNFEKIEVKKLVQKMSSHWNDSEWKINKNKLKIKESIALKLNCEKASIYLDWKPTLNIDETIKYTIGWYKNYYFNLIENNMYSNQQIEGYIESAKINNIKWAKQYHLK